MYQSAAQFTFPTASCFIGPYGLQAAIFMGANYSYVCVILYTAYI